MASNQEWEIPNSDDERDEELILASKNGEIPLKVLEYYEQIEQNKVLELQVEEFRKSIPISTDVSKEEVDISSEEGKCEENSEMENKSKDAIVNLDDEDKREEKKRVEPSEFDEFDEPEECQGHIPRRTPKSGRLPKKRVGTLKNVISNLKRFREMDNVSDNKDNKNNPPDETKDEKTSDTTEENSQEAHDVK